MRRLALPLALLAATPLATPLAAQRGAQPIDTAYTRQITALTPVHPQHKFTTELVDYLPASATVPTPLAVLGYVPGTTGRLSKTAEVHKYFRALDAASPRVRIFSLGMSDEGREMLAAAIGDSATIARVDEYRQMLHQLSDPRGLAPEAREQILREGKPVYWLTGTIHSPETGSPEMLMELAYRLAVDEGEQARAIRRDVITLVTPILEVDGRDRRVDTYTLSKSLGLGPNGVPLVYWGKYTAHDNNRDAMVLSQKLTQGVASGFLHWRPTVAHDLHESVPFLYTSTGTGPYNDEYDPIVVNEWNQLAYQEINELTRRGLPGVWTHGFYDGWTPNYTVLAFANLHNSIGRFYETYTSMGAECHVVNLGNEATERRWYRSNIPVNGVRWCIRSNINYQQSGVLVALRHVADNRRTFLENAVAKAERMVQRGRATAPYAYVIPRSQHRAAEAAALVNLFRRHGSEVHVADKDFIPSGPASRVPDSGGRQPTVATSVVRDSTSMARDSVSGTRCSRTGTPGVAGSPGACPESRSPAPGRSIKARDWIVRLDQPYAATVRTLLATQRFKADDPPPYDDTGWTLDLLRHVETFAVADSAVLAQPMTRLDADAVVEGKVTGRGDVLLVRHLGDWRSAALPWKLAGTAGARVHVADSSFRAGDTTFAAGTAILAGLTAAQRQAAERALKALGLDAVAVERMPEVPRHPVTPPRIAYVHSWLETQNEGWVRFVLDEIGIPYTYMSDQALARPGVLERYDVVLYPHVSGGVRNILNGRPMVGPAVPWRKTAATPHLGGLDETADVRPGMGLEGAAALRRFVERGGVLITEGGTSLVPVELGFNTSVNTTPARTMRAPGSIFRAQVVTASSPVLYGYERTTFPVYFNQAPLLTVTPRDTTSPTEPLLDRNVIAERERMRARVLLKFHQRADSLLLSGLLTSPDELAGKAAVVDAPLGRGRMILFAIRPMWRYESQGTFAMVLNALAHWNHLAPRTAAAPSAVAAARQ